MNDYRDLDRYLEENYESFEEIGQSFFSAFSFQSQAREAERYEEDLDIIKELDESFSKTVLKLIDERGLKDSDVYNSINMDRRLFSKLRNDDYSPSKQTAIALCIALKLDLKESSELLEKAGYALSHANKGDVIVEYFIDKGIYDIYTIDEALLHYDQKPIGRY